MSGPLAGVKVVDWGMFINGVATGYILGDLGADVIKVEEPIKGDAGRGLVTLFGAGMTLPGGRVITFETANRNKRSITLNLRHDRGQRLLHKLVEQADVFTTNFSQEVAERCGADWPTLSTVNPKLIYACSTAYGDRGSGKRLRAFDTCAQARSGLMHAIGDQSTLEPAIAVGAVMDQGASTMLAFGVVAALFSRERCGEGQMVQTSLLGHAIHLQALNINTAIWRGRGMGRHSRQRATNPLGNHYRCADGKWLLFSEPQSARFWGEFCQAIGRPELENDASFGTATKRTANTSLISILDEVFAAKTRDEWVQLLDARGCRFAYAPVLSPEEAAGDEQAIENRYVVDFEHPTLGKVKTVGFPLDFSATPAEIRCAAPEFGQHTEEVLQDLGYGWDEISELRDSGVI